MDTTRTRCLCVAMHTVWRMTHRTHGVWIRQIRQCLNEMEWYTRTSIRTRSIVCFMSNLSICLWGISIRRTRIKLYVRAPSILIRFERTRTPAHKTLNDILTIVVIVCRKSYRIMILAENMCVYTSIAYKWVDLFLVLRKINYHTVCVQSYSQSHWPRVPNTNCMLMLSSGVWARHVRTRTHCPRINCRSYYTLCFSERVWARRT